MSIDLILGTAGHIDHGKTALVKALTGVDTDRLPEEKRRGITIDLGFAELVLGQYRLGIVDVPGHEKFVRNMLAGATGIDLALLVIAADDSIMPQTREHLEILRLLDLDSIVVALTKCDLCEPEWIELVEQDVSELLGDIARQPIRTSTATGQGIDQLREVLIAAAGRAADSKRRNKEQGPFRMAIDRAFTVAGHGTIVTGSVSSGRVRLADELVIQPGEIPVRVRGIQNHTRNVEEVRRGQRAAINLAGVHHNQLQRGCELAARGHLSPSRLLSVSLSLLDSAPRPLKHRARVRLHVGTAELMASVKLLDRDLLEPGNSAPAQLFLGRPAVTTWGQPLVIRSESPVMTIGGGHVIDPNASKLRRKRESVLTTLEELRSDDPMVRSSAAVYFAGFGRWEPADLARTAGVDEVEGVCRELVERGDLLQIVVSPTRTIRIHRRAFEELADRVEAVLATMHQDSPRRSQLDRSRLANRFVYLDAPLFDALLGSMSRAGRIELTQRGVALADYRPQLSNNERKLLDEILQTYRAAEFRPPSVEQVKAGAAKNQAAVPELIELAAEEGRLVKVSRDFYLHADVESRMRELLATRLSGGKGLTVSEIREVLSTTRKYAVPFCEYLDQIGVTQRQGDVRVLKVDV